MSDYHNPAGLGLGTFMTMFLFNLQTVILADFTRLWPHYGLLLPVAAEGSRTRVIRFRQTVT